MKPFVNNHLNPCLLVFNCPAIIMFTKWSMFQVGQRHERSRAWYDCRWQVGHSNPLWSQAAVQAAAQNMEAKGAQAKTEWLCKSGWPAELLCLCLYAISSISRMCPLTVTVFAFILVHPWVTSEWGHHDEDEDEIKGLGKGGVDKWQCCVSFSSLLVAGLVRVLAISAVITDWGIDMCFFSLPPRLFMVYSTVKNPAVIDTFVKGVIQ